MNKEYKLFEAANELSLMLMYLTRFTEKNLMMMKAFFMHGKDTILMFLII
jgi:hypothetical protein